MESNFKCEKCKDEGYTLKEIDGYLTAIPCSCQKMRKIESIMRSSGVNYEEYTSKTLDSFNIKTDIAKRMKDTALKFLEDEDATGIGYFGRSGTGKTHICIALCLELSKQNELVHKYFPYRQEIQKLKSSFYDFERYQKQMDRWINCDVLFIDDLFKFANSKDNQIQNQDLQIMFDIINTRYLDKALTIFSSELSVKEITSIDEALGSRIYSMVIPYGVSCDGENVRFKK